MSDFLWGPGSKRSISIQALAARTANKIFQRYFGGDRWVQTEAHLSSIEPAVRKAVIERGLSVRNESDLKRRRAWFVNHHGIGRC